MAGRIKGITIEIGGDTTRLDKALKGINTTSRDLNTQLREVNNSLKFNPGNTDLIAQKQRILAESVDNTKKKLETLKAAQKDAQEALAQGKIGQDVYDELQREILKTENQLKSFETEQQKMNSSWENTSKKLESFASGTKKAGEALTKGVTVPILGIGAASMKAFNEVDEGLDTIAKKTGATGDSMKGLENSFKNVYQNFPADSATVGNAIGEVNTQFGFLGKELENKTTLMLKFAQVNGQDVTQATIQSKQAIEAFNLSGKDIDMVLDSVTSTAQKTGVATDKLFESVVKGAPALQGLGLNFGQSVALMGQFEQSGVDSSKAISYLTKAQANWAKEGKTMTQGLSELTSGIKGAKNEQEAIALATEVFGTKAGPMMAKAIKDGKLSFDELAGAANSAKGAVNSTFDETKDPVDDFTVAMNNLKTIGMELGAAIQESLAPVLKSMIEKLKDFSQWFQKLSPHQKELLVKIALIAAALGPILVGIGGLITGIIGLVANLAIIGPTMTTVTGALATAIPIIAGVLAAILIGEFIYSHWEEIKNFFVNIWNSIKSIAESVWNALKNFFQAILSAIKAFFIVIFTGIKTFLENIWNGIKTVTINVWNTIKSLITTILNDIKNLFNSIFNFIKTLVINMWNAIRNTTSSTWNSIRRTISNILNSIKNTFANIFNSFKNIVVNAFNNVRNAVSNGLSNAYNTVTGFAGRFFNAGRNIIGSIVDGIKSAISWVTDAIEDVTQTIRDYLPFSPAKEGPLRDLNKLNFGGTISEGIYAGKSKVQSAIDSILDVPEIPFGGVGGYFPSANRHGQGTAQGNSGEIVIHIENMNVSDKDDARKVGEELFKLTEKAKRGRGV